MKKTRSARKPIPGQTAVRESLGAVVETRPSQLWEGVTYQLAHNVYYRGGSEPRLSKNAYWRAYWYDKAAGKKRSKYIGLEFEELAEADFQEG